MSVKCFPWSSPHHRCQHQRHQRNINKRIQQFSHNCLKKNWSKEVVCKIVFFLCRFQCVKGKVPSKISCGLSGTFDVACLLSKYSCNTQSEQLVLWRANVHTNLTGEHCFDTLLLLNEIYGNYGNASLLHDINQFPSACFIGSFIHSSINMTTNNNGIFSRM